MECLLTTLVGVFIGIITVWLHFIFNLWKIKQENLKRQENNTGK